MGTPDLSALKSIVETLHEGAALVNLNDSHWPVVWFNPAFAAMSAELVGTLDGQSAYQLVDAIAGASGLAEVTDAIASATRVEIPLDTGRGSRLFLTYVPLTNKKRVRRKQGWLLLRYADALEHRTATAAMETELGEARQRLRDLSDDVVTGLASEQRFRDTLRRDFAQGVRQSSSLSLIIYRMDAYDAYLATFGEHATDSCLRMLARTVTRRLRRGSDLAGRAGDDHIAILMLGVAASDADRLAEKIVADVEALRIHHPRSATAKFVTVSHSTRTIVPGGEDDADAWLNAVLADIAVETAPHALLNQA